MRYYSAKLVSVEMFASPPTYYYELLSKFLIPLVVPVVYN